MSPFERHDDNLKDLRLGGSGRGAPGGGGPPDTDTGEIGDAEGTAEETPEELGEEMVEEEIERLAAKADMSGVRHPGPWRRLYRGETSFDFVGRRRWWFLLSAVIIVAGLASLGTRGLNLGITFKGGTAWIVKTSTLSQPKAEALATAAGVTQPTVEVLGTGSSRTIEVQGDLNHLATAQKTKIRADVIAELAKAAHVSPKQVSTTSVGPTWGGQVTQKAIEALIVFFIVVAVYISLRFEPKMALAAFIAMIHDLLVTVGVYSLAGFQVTPDTVIAVLTILGYSLYDTVVVFTRVRDNTKGFGASGRMTYSEMINLSMNQTMARSMNTSLVAILPVLSVLLIGAELLGATTLKDYGLALTVGLISGAYSSIFIASPVLAMLKEREPRYTTIRQRLESRGDRVGLLTPAAAAALVAAGAGGAGSARIGKAGGSSTRAGTLRPGAARRPAPASRAGAPARGGAAARAGGPARAGGSQAPATPRGTSPGVRASATGSSGTAAARRPPPRPRKGGGKGKKRR